MVLHAMLAVSALHTELVSGQQEIEISYYHGMSLRLVIAAISRSEALCDDNLLAIVCCLRVYAELVHHWS